MCANLDGEVIVCECYQRGFKLGLQVGSNSATQEVETELVGWVKSLTDFADRLDKTNQYLREYNAKKKGTNESP